MSTRLSVITLLLVLLAPGPVRAQSPLVAELKSFALRYHEDPARLDKLYQGLAEAVKTDSHLENWLALAEISFVWGDVRARTTEERLEAYERGRKAGQRAAELAPRNALAHFWYGTNSGRWGQTKGILRSLFLLPTVKEEMQAALDLDPKLVPAYSLAGQVYAEVPGFLGGDLDKSEELFRKGLDLDPRFTGLRVALAKTLIKKKRYEEARRQLQSVVDEKAPRNPADWTMKDVKQARELLDSLKGKS